MSDDPSQTPPADEGTPQHAADGDAGTNTAVAKPGDKVAMLSLRADGTPDQLNPTFVGDEASTLAATTEQFKQQAVSAADLEARREIDATSEEDAKQDPTVAALAEAHEAAADEAAAAAERAVEGLSR